MPHHRQIPLTATKHEVVEIGTCFVERSRGAIRVGEFGDVLLTHDERRDDRVHSSEAV